jgi:quercetin dioxygenase-like cupin family protein
MFAWATPVCGQQPGVQRRTLLQYDSAPGYQTVVNVVEFAPGAHEIRHTHPGTLSVYVLEGAVTLEYEGHPTATYKAGDAYYIEAGKIHTGGNETATPMKILSTLVFEKGKPPSSPAP